MSNDVTDLPTPLSHRWLAWVAWIVILAIVGFSVVGRELFVRSPVAREAANEGSLDLIAFQLQARYLVGVKHLFEQLKQDIKNADFIAQAKTVNVGRIPQRLRAIATVSELAGPEAALAEVDALQTLIDQHEPDIHAADAQTIQILRTLWSDPDQHLEAVKSLTDEQRTVLNDRLGWFGELIQHPRGTHQATREAVLKPALGAAFSVLLAFLGAIAIALVGIAVLVVFLMRAAGGGLIRGFVAGSPNGRIYVERFGLWILLYPSLSLASGYASPYLGMTLAASLAMFTSLLALAWPVMRGIPWKQVRSDIGWTAGRGGWLEPFWGIVAYVMTMPWLGVGLVFTILLIFLQRSFGLDGASGDPFYAPPSSAHPIIVPLARGDLWDRLSIFFLASVAAPIVEETMFRGVFYRHLREATRHWRLLASFLFSALTSSVIFAAVHPQGWVAIPVLASLAFGFCVAREWRGSLLACMIAHGLSNGLVLLIAVAALG